MRDNSREAKQALRYKPVHNRRLGGSFDMRALKWRAWRRSANRWLREIVQSRGVREDSLA